MAHVTEIVRYEKLSNGQFAFHIRCCGNASSDYPATLQAADAADAVIRKEKLDKARAECALMHEHAIQAEAGALDEIGTQTFHEEGK